MNVIRNFLLLVVLVTASSAHPGTGIVQDSKGNVYYTDLKQVWRITPEGVKTIVVSNVHTHELVLDGADNLYGEHLWFNGEHLNTWGHYVWKRTSGGAVTKVIPSTEGFLRNYSFVRDAEGSMYWVERGNHDRILKKNVHGSITAVTTATFKGIGRLHVRPDGTLYFIERYSLRSVSPNGLVRTLAEIDGKPSAGSNGPDEANRFHSLWSDSGGSVFIADGGEKQIKKVTQKGELSVTFHSADEWSPSGGMVGRNGELWLLEYSPSNEVRVRKIGGSSVRIF